ncbi:MAG: hypothetical protein ABL890_03895 [Candidatus Peribacteraceae bacterium]
MRSLQRSLAGLTALCILVMPYTATAVGTTPDVYTYQGRLLDSAGAPIATAHTFRVSLWKSADWVSSDTTGTGAINSGATNYGGWNEVQTVTPNSSGVFTIQLGSNTALPVVDFASHKYLQVEVKTTAGADTTYQRIDPTGDSGTDTNDRMVIGSQPYAENAESVENRTIGTGSGNIIVLGPNGTISVARMGSGTTSLGFKINNSNSAGDTTLSFGNTTLTQNLKFSHGNQRFEFSKDLQIAGSLGVTGAISGSSLSIAGATTLRSQAYTWPGNAGALDKMLVTDGAGNLAWKSVSDLPAVTISNSTDYIFVNTSTGSQKKITKSALLGSLIGAVQYKGTWNANTNSPTLANAGSASQVGHYYVTSTLGSTNFGSGSISFLVGDWVINNGGAWQKISGSNDVVSVFNRQGAVTAQLNDYSGALITNVPSGAISATTVQGAITQLNNRFSNFVNRQGDTMTGALRIANNAGLSVSGSLVTNTDLSLNSDNGATDATVTFGNSTLSQTLKFAHTSQRFEFSKDLYITGALGVAGAISGTSLNVNTTSTFGGVATHNAAVKVRGNLSGSTLTVDQLRSCNTIDTDANGNLVCGTDSGGTQFSNTGSLEAYFNSKFVNVSGDTMTGGLVGTAVSATKATITGSGRILHSTPGMIGGIKDDSNLQNPQSVYVAGKYAYIVTNVSNNLRIYDVSNPSSPTYVGGLGSLGNAAEVVVQGRYAYVIASGKLHVIDVSNPASPSLSATLTDSTNLLGATGLAVQGRYAFATAYNANLVVAIDVINPGSPIIVGTLATTAPYDIAVSGRYAYVAHISGSNMKVLDISNPAGMSTVATLSNSDLNNGYSIAISLPHVYVGTSAKVVAVNVSSASSPVISNTLSVGAINVFVAGTQLYTTDQSNDRLNVVDISNPSAMSTLTSFTDSTNLDQAQNVFVSGNKAYVVAQANNSLRVLDISGLDTPSLRAGTIEAGSINAMNMIQADSVNATASMHAGAGGISTDGQLRTFGGIVSHNALNIRSGAGMNASGSLLTNTNITLNSDNGATNGVLTFGNQTASQTLTLSNTNQRFEFSKDLYITGALGVAGAISGASLNVNTTSTFGGVATHNAAVKVRGNLSGSTLTVDQLRNCNTIDTDANGNLSCGTDSGGTQFSNTGSLEAYFNSKFVNVSGDTMTGTLRIANNAGLNTSGSLLTNTDLTVNSDNGATDATVTFGNSTLAQTLKFSHANQRFELSKDIRVLGTMSGRGLYVKGIAEIQATGTAGGVADGGAVRLGHGQDNGIVFRAQSNGSNRTGMFLSGAALYVGAAGSNGFYTATNVTLGGNVGVGTTTPGSKLSVSGSVIIGANGNLSSTAADAGVALEVLGFMSGYTLNISGSGTKFRGLQYFWPTSIAGGSGSVLKVQSNGQLYWGTAAAAGGGNTTFQTVTNANASATDWTYTVLVTAGAAVRTITLPTAVDNTGKFIEVKKVDSGTGSVVIDGFGSEEIDTGSGVTISNQGGTVVVRSDGTNVKLVADTAAYAAEYGSNLTITDAQTTTSTSNTDVTGGSFTLPSAGTWRVTVNVNTAITAGAAGDVSLLLTDSNNTAVAGSYITLRGEANGSFLSATREVFITTTQVATYKLRWRVGSGDTATIYNDANSSTNIAWEKVGGFQPVLGQKVDYVNVIRTGTNQTGIGAGSGVIFNTVVGGNIPYNTTTGVFTLTAGKTYELDATLQMRGNGAGGTNRYALYNWVDADGGTNLTNIQDGVTLLMTSDLNQGPSSAAKGIYTPTTNQTIKVQIGPTNGNGLEIDLGRSSASIRQLGSTATTSTPKVIVMARDDSTQSIPSNDTVTITWDTEEIDTTNSLNAGTGIFTAPRAGYYRVSFGLSMSAFSTTASNFGRGILERNNTGIFGQEWRVDTANTILPFFNGSATILLAANDTLRVRLQNSGLGNQFLGGNLRDNWFSIEEVPASY